MKLKHRFFQNRIKNSMLMKNILANAAIIIVLVVSILSVVYVVSSNILSKEIEQQIRLKLTDARTKIDETHEDQQRQLNLLSRSSDIDGILGGGVIPAFDNQTKAIMENFTPNMENILVINNQGKVVYDSNNGSKSLVDSDLSSRQYFIDSQSGKASYSDILVSKATGHSIQVVSVPIERDGSVIGVLATTMNIGYLSDILKEIKIEKSGYAVLIDHEGNFVYHPKAALIGTNMNALGVKKLTAAFPDMQAGKEGKVYYTFKNIGKLQLFIPMGKWCLSINAVRSEYLAPVTEMFHKIVILGLLLLLLAAGITAYTSYKTVKRIYGVRNVIGVVTKGDMTVAIDEKNLKTCWEVTGCGKADCIAYQNSNLKCWEISGTLCNGEVQADALGKIDRCKSCAVYRASEGDELGQMTRGVSVMVTTIRGLILGISKISEQLSASSQQLSSASEETTTSAESISSRMEDMSYDAQHQTKYAEQIHGRTQDMNQQLIECAEKILHMDTEAKDVNSRAAMGNQKIKHTISGMEEIKVQTEKIGQVMEALLQHSTEIGEINSLITSIASQTKLLSLNASIEAARAGEHGRGFSVVAEEIGKLSEQSQKSAQDISVLIDRITDSIENAHQLMDQETQYVQNGILTVNESRSAFEDITGNVASMMTGMEEVVAFVESVKSSSLTVTQEIEKMAGIIEESGADIEEITASTQEQSSVSEEISKSAEELTKMAEELLLAVSKFTV